MPPVPAYVPYEITAAPQPFVDWALIDAGRVNWLSPEDGTESGDRPWQALPVGVASGVRLRTVPATQPGRIFKDVKPWEDDLRLGSSQFLDDDIFRLWYFSATGIVYGQSGDGITWTRPLIDFVPFAGYGSTNLMPPIDNTQGRPIALHEGTFFRDDNAGPEARYKAVFTAAVTEDELRKWQRGLRLPASAEAYAKKKAIFAAISPDGLCWAMLDKPIMLHAGDPQITLHYDRALKRYVAFMCVILDGRRCIGRAETTDFSRWPLPVPVLSPGLDAPPHLDLFNNAFAEYPGNAGVKLMFPTVFDRGRNTTTVRLAASRDGILWHWVPGAPVIAPGPPGTFDAAGVFASPGFIRTTKGPLCLLYAGSPRPFRYPHPAGPDYQFATALWEEDRLGALESPEVGEFTSGPLRLRGTRLLMNLTTAHAGEVRVEVRDEQYRQLANHTMKKADPLIGDHRWTPLTWQGSADLSALRDQVVYLRVTLRAATLFALKAGE